MGKVISVCDTKEGYSKSVIGINLAICLASQSRENATFVDFSFSGLNSIEHLLNFKNSKSLGDILPIIQNLDAKLIKGYLPAHSSGVVLLDGASRENKPKVKPADLVQLINILSSAYPFTIINTPDEYDEHLVSILESSDLLFLNVFPHALALNQAQIFLDTFKSWHLPLNMVKPLTNKMDSNSGIDSKKIEDYLGISIFGELPYESEILFSSINNSVPIVLSSPHSNFAVEIKKIAKGLIEGKVFEGITKPSSVKENISAASVPSESDTAAIKKASKELKQKIHRELISELDLKNTDLKGLTDSGKLESVKEKTRKKIQDLLANENNDLSREERIEFVEELLNEVLGLGCLEGFLKDPQVTEIMVNGPDDIYLEKKGKIQLADSHFTSNTQLLTIIDRIVSPIGRRVDEASPIVDARLLDGSRVNVIIPPVSLVGPSITIRKFSQKKLIAEDLIGFGAMKSYMAEFLRICVQLRKNIVISGGTGSGKTTLLNVVSSFIPPDERIVTIEDSAELKLPQKHVVRLESRPASIEGSGEISIRRLVINALRMRPDRIVVGECRGGEALDMLQAMNTGHDGSLTTVHANTPKDAVSRISTMVIMAGTELPERAIKEQIGSAIQVIVQLSRLSDGSRKIVEIAEVAGIKDDAIQLFPLFKFEQTGLKDNKVIGKFTATGNIPSFFDEIEPHGLKLNKTIFNKGEIQ